MHKLNESKKLFYSLSNQEILFARFLKICPHRVSSFYIISIYLIETFPAYYELLFVEAATRGVL